MEDDGQREGGPGDGGAGEAMRKSIDEVRHELHQLKNKSRMQHQVDVNRAEAAEKEAIKQRFRADAFETALKAVIDDMKKLGLRVGPRE